MGDVILLCLLSQPGNAAVPPAVDAKEVRPLSLDRVKRQLEGQGWKFITERKNSEQKVVTWKKDSGGKDFAGKAFLKFSWVVIAGPFDVPAGQQRTAKIHLKESPTYWQTFLLDDEKEFRLDVQDEPPRLTAENGWTSKLSTKLSAEQGKDHKEYIVQQKAELIENGKTLAVWFTGPLGSASFVKSVNKK